MEHLNCEVGVLFLYRYTSFVCFAFWGDSYKKSYKNKSKKSHFFACKKYSNYLCHIDLTTCRFNIIHILYCQKLLQFCKKYTIFAPWFSNTCPLWVKESHLQFDHIRLGCRHTRSFYEKTFTYVWILAFQILPP